MKKIICIVMLVLGMAVVSCSQTTVELTWVSTGDDGMIGTASFYDIRYFTDSLTDANWDDAIQITGEPIPKVSGSSERFEIEIIGLQSETKYYFAMKVGDEVPNWSILSNVVSFVTPDNLAPDNITTLVIRIIQ